MRRLVGTALILQIAMHGGAVRADPGAPLIAPSQGRREDTQRLTEQLRSIDREHAPEPVVPAPRGQPAASAPEGRRTPVVTFAGVVLLFVAGVSGLTTLTLYATTPSVTMSDTGSLDTAKAAFLTTTVLTGVAGLVFVVAGRQVQVSPAAAPRTVGLAITGAL